MIRRWRHLWLGLLALPLLAQAASPGVVIVTGGTLGIGKETIKRLYAEGWKVATFARDPEKIAALRKEFPDPNRFYAEPLAITDLEKVRSFVDDVERRLGPVDHLVNNVGDTGPLVRAGMMTPSQIQGVVSVNLIGTINLSSDVIERMESRGTHGVILNLSSGSSEGVPGLATYAAAKAGVNVFTASAAKEYGAKGIRIFALNPGHVDTRLQTAARLADPEVFPSATAFAGFYDRGELVSPADSAGHIDFLLTHPEDFKNGAYLSYQDVAAKATAGTVVTGEGMWTTEEAAASRALAIERMTPHRLNQAGAWEEFPVIKVDDVVIAPPKDIVDLDTRVLREIHQRIASSRRPIVRLQFGSRFVVIDRTPIGQGMAGAVYSIPDSDQVIKIAKPIPLSLISMFRERDRAQAIEALAAQEPTFHTPHNYEFSPEGLYAIKERVRGTPLSQVLIDQGVIHLVAEDGKTKAVLATGEALQTALNQPVMRDVEREIRNLMELRHRHPDEVSDLGPDNLMAVFDPAGKLKYLSLVDIGPTASVSKKRFDDIYPQGFPGYLKVAEILVNRYLKTGVFEGHAARPGPVATPPEPGPHAPVAALPSLSPEARTYLEREAQNEYPITSAVNPDYLPGHGEFRIPYLLIPKDEMHVVDSGLGSARLRRLLFETVKKDGKEYVRFPIHPESLQLYQPLIDRYGIAGEYTAAATSSTRTVYAQGDRGRSHGQLKLSLAQYQSKRSRVVPAWEVRRSVGVTATAALTPAKTWRKSGASIIGDVAGAYVPEHWKLGSFVDAKQGEVFEHGVLLRDDSFLKQYPSDELYPLFSLFADRGSKPPIVIELWKKSGEPDFHKFLDEFLFKPFLAENRYLIFHQGIIPEMHSQNLIVHLDPKTGRIDHFFHRDAGSMKIDLRMRWLNGLSIAPLRSDNAAFDFKFQRSTEVIEEDFIRYLHNETIVNGALATIRKYVPDFDPEKTREELRTDLHQEIRRDFPLRDPTRHFDTVAGHLEQYYRENVPAEIRPIAQTFEPAAVQRFVRERSEHGQAMPLPEEWAKAIRLPESGYLVTEYGVVYSSRAMGLPGDDHLMLAFHRSADLREIRPPAVAGGDGPCPLGELASRHG